MDDRTLQDLAWTRVVAHAATFAQTDRGRALVLDLPPLRDAAACRDELGLVDEGRELLQAPERPSLDGVEDAEAFVDGARRGMVLSSQELVAVARMVGAGMAARQVLIAGRLRAPHLAELVANLKDLSFVAERVADTFDADGRIRDDASPRLGELRGQVLSLGRRVKERIEQMLQDRQVQPLLQDEYYTLREGRYVLPVKTEDRRFVSGIIHGTSQTGATLFIEPQSIVDDNNQLKVVLDRIEVEEHAILADRSRLVGRFADDIRTLASSVWRLDSVLARARMALAMGGNLPELGGEGGLHLIEARNPILLILGRDVVPVSVHLPGPGHALVISGPNAGGKSVTLSTVGLCCIMTRFGLLPPVGPDSRVPWFERILSVIGDPTSLDRQVSNFTGQLQRVRQVLEHGPGRTLALLDELATGTEPAKGEAFAAAIVQTLVDTGAECLVATHYDLLKRLAADDARFGNASVGLDARTGRPSFRLEQGTAGESNPFGIAESIGFPQGVIDRARAMASDRERRLEEALTAAERLRTDLAREKAETEDLKIRLVADKKKYESELQRLRRDSDRLVYDARREVLEKMKRLEEELDQIARTARKEVEMKKIVNQRAEVREKKADVRAAMDREASLAEGVPAEPMPAAEVRVGAEVYVFALRSVGRVVDLSGDGRRATVQVGLMKSVVKVADLRRPPKGKPQPPKPKPAPRPAASPVAPAVPAPVDEPMRTSSNTVDCRGSRLDEAIVLVDKRLDEAMVMEEPVVYVLHGMGTSALRRGIRDYLRTSRYCRAFRAGTMEEGGEAITVVTVKL